MRRNLLSVLLTLLVLLLIEGAPIAAQSDVAILDALPGCGFTEAYDDISGLQVGAVIYNFETGEGCVENLDTTFPVASVPKVFVSAAYQQMVVQGMLSPQQTIRFSEDYLMGGGGDCLNDGDLGRDISLRELNEIMITCSDNAATWMLMDLMGWDYVDYYVDSIGLTSVGPVVPYAEVDRAKLAIIDPLWSQVPAAFASRFMRRRQTEGLDTYFSTAPRFSGRQYREASQIYFDTYDYNTATPRDIARFFARLRDDYRNDFGANGQIAASVINTMLETQRQYSTQAFPGTVYVGSKNGFDTGLVAEVNFTLHSLAGFDRTPAAMAIIFTRQTNLLVENVQQPRQSEGVLNQLLRDLSPRIVDILYPDFTPPPVTPNWSLNTVHIGLPEAVNNCWSNYRQSGFDAAFVGDFESCLSQTPEPLSFASGEPVALGLVLHELNYEDTRLTFIFTAPDGTPRSYQARARLTDDAGINWFHPVDERGEWTIDIYLNLQHVHSETVLVR